MERDDNLRRMYKFWILSIAISLTATGMYKVINNYYEKKYADNGPEIVITATDLIEQYVSNELLADELYKNEIIKVTGTISGKVGDNVVITIDIEGTDYSLNCNFDNINEIYELATYDVGDNIVIIGEVRGIYLSKVSIIECRIE